MLGKITILKSFITCTLHKKLRSSNQGTRGREYRAYMGEIINAYKIWLENTKGEKPTGRQAQME
jgi:hypothetical protein